MPPSVKMVALTSTSEGGSVASWPNAKLRESPCAPWDGPVSHPYRSEYLTAWSTRIRLSHKCRCMQPPCQHLGIPADLLQRRCAREACRHNWATQSGCDARSRGILCSHLAVGAGVCQQGPELTDRLQVCVCCQVGDEAHSLQQAPVWAVRQPSVHARSVHVPAHSARRHREVSSWVCLPCIQ